MQGTHGVEWESERETELRILGRKMSMKFFLRLTIVIYAQNANNKNIIYFTHSG